MPSNVVLVSNEDGKVASSSLSLNNLQGVIIGGATTITDNNLTPNKVVISDGAGKVSASTISNIEVGYLAGTNDLIQNQLDSKANQSTTYTKIEVDTQLSNLIDSAPDVLNTLNELADALNDDANYATTIQNQFATKQNNISNLPGTGEILLESDFLKRIYGVSPLNVTTYFNSNDPNDINNANIQLSIDLSSYATIATTYNQTEVDTLIANIPLSSYYTQTQLDTMFSTYYLKTDVDTLLTGKQDNLSNASAQVGIKTYPLLLNNTIKQLKFENPLDVSEELDNRITVQLLNSHITYTSSLTFQDVNNLSLNTLQIKGGTSGIEIVDFNNNSLMDLDNTQISVNKPLVCSSTGYFTGDVTAANLYNKTQIDTLIANIPLSSYYTQAQLDTMFSTYYLKTEVDTLLSSKHDNLSNASGEAGVKSYHLLLVC